MIPRLLSKSTQFARSLIDDFREFISPSICIGCGGNIDSASRFLCPGCRNTITGDNPGQGPVCPFCGRPDGAIGSCRLCSAPEPLLLYFWGIYDGLLKECITQFKFGGMHVLGRELAAMSSDALLSRLRGSGYDLIIPVPLCKARRRAREFNQSEIIAGVLAETLGIEMNAGILIRSRSTSQQAKLAEPQRWENVKDAFAMAEDSDLSGKKILLVDDIVTTGATVFEACRPLKAAGARKIEIFSLAYAL